MTEISVGIPFQRLDAPLVGAIESVREQTLDDWQLILHFDGSAADLPEFPDYIAEDPRIRILHHTKHEGLAATLNAIAAATLTPYLARMDADDVMHSRRLELQLAALRETDADVLASRAWVIDDDDCVVGAYRELDLPDSCSGYLASNAFTHPAVAGRSDWFRHNAYDVSIARAEDKELWLRAHHSSKYVKMEDRLLYYRVPRRVGRDKTLRTFRDNFGVIRSGRVCGGIGRRDVAISLLKATVKVMIQLVLLMARMDSALIKSKLEPVDEAVQTAAANDPALGAARKAREAWTT